MFEMKKLVIYVSAVVMTISASGAMAAPKTKAKEKKEPVKVLVNGVDSMSYALGLQVGGTFSQNIKKIPGGKSNVDLILMGFATAMKGDSSLISKTVADAYLRTYMMEAQKKEMDAKKEASAKFLEENKTKEGVITTASGLQYQVVVPAAGPKPAPTDSVTVHYTGTLIDGTKFDSSVDRGQPITFPLNQVIPGWTEGLQLMSPGSKYKFFIPYNLAYGEQGAGPTIPGFSTLIFDVELISIKPYVAPKVESKPQEETKSNTEAADSAKAKKKVTSNKK
jgi:FKBP-type peptidyl-prolyl cis-trans isomerase